MSSQVQNLALVGASGNLGKPVLDALLGVNSNINITVITRQESTVTFPSAVTVKKGDYTSSAFLSSALQGIDILVLILGISALGDEQDRLIEAAAKAGVKYVLPTEFGSDTADERMLRAVPLLQHKKAVQARIADLGMKCISVITNPWFDFSLRFGLYGIDVAGRKATVYTDSARFNAGTIKGHAAGIAKLLLLPEDRLAKYANGYVYLGSMMVTQPEIFEAVKHATGTSDGDWLIERKTVQERLDEGHAKLQAGDRTGMYELVYGNAFKAGVGGDYARKLDVQSLGLPDELLDEAVHQALQGL